MTTAAERRRLMRGGLLASSGLNETADVVRAAADRAEQLHHDPPAPPALELPITDPAADDGRPPTPSPAVNPLPAVPPPGFDPAGRDDDGGPQPHPSVSAGPAAATAALPRTGGGEPIAVPGSAPQAGWGAAAETHVEAPGVPPVTTGPATLADVGLPIATVRSALADTTPVQRVSSSDVTARVIASDPGDGGGVAAEPADATLATGPRFERIGPPDVALVERGVVPAAARPVLDEPVVVPSGSPLVGGQRRMPAHGRYTIQLPAELFERVEQVRDGWPRTSWMLTLIGAHHDEVVDRLTTGLVIHPQLGTIRRRTRRSELGPTCHFQLQFGRTEQGRAAQLFFEERAGAAGSITEYVVAILEAHLAAVRV